MNSLRDKPPIEPLLDTWGRFSNAACWRWSPRTSPTSDEASVLNAWGLDIDQYGDPRWCASSGANAARGMFG